MTDTEFKHRGDHEEGPVTQIEDPKHLADEIDFTEMAEIIKVTHALDSAYRCERCGAEAYYEVELRVGGDLYFCRHHYHEHGDKLMQVARRIVDHEAYLNHQEHMFKGGTPIK